MKVLDLCAGTGSATQAFVDRGHEVETLDIIGRHTYICDIRDFRPNQGKYHFIWCSPVCREFSLNLRIACKDRNPDMSLVFACQRVITEAQPIFWIMENPTGCLRYFIGKPQKRVLYRDYGAPVCKPTDLWGIFPEFNNNGIKKQPQKLWKDQYPCHNDPGRAKVPYGLSLAICKALENELT